MLTDRLTRVVEHPDIDVMVSSELVRLDGFVGNFKATIVVHGPEGADEERQVDVGSVIVCTGYREFDASRATHLGYGKLPNVITSFEFERMLRAGPDRDQGGAPAPVRLRRSTASAAAARSSTATVRASAA